jgi:hypothetical protein
MKQRLMVLALICSSLPVIAHEQDIRTYMAVTVGITDFSKGYRLSIFGKNENRFRSQGLVYDKEFLGVKQGLGSWFMLRLYWVHKDLWYKSHRAKSMCVFEFFVHHRFGPFGFVYRNGNEWHVTDRFYRNREKLELQGFLPKPAQWLYFWASEEFRVDSDQSRVNMNDWWLGVGFRPKKALNLRLFWGMEHKRRLKPDWNRTDILGIMVSVSI